MREDFNGAAAGSRAELHRAGWVAGRADAGSLRRVRSRCQRMDFRRGTLSDLAGNIRRVLEAEGIEFEEDAVAAVARAAEGSFRDSLSLLEQALAFSDERRLSAEAVHASIGTVGPQ